MKLSSAIRGLVGASAVLALVAGCGGGADAVNPAAARDVPRLIDELKVTSGPNDWNRRNLAASRLGRMGAMASSAVDELTRVAQEDPNPTVRKTAGEALTRIRGPQS